MNHQSDWEESLIAPCTCCPDPDRCLTECIIGNLFKEDKNEQIILKNLWGEQQ